MLMRVLPLAPFVMLLLSVVVVLMMVLVLVMVLQLLLCHYCREKGTERSCCYRYKFWALEHN